MALLVPDADVAFKILALEHREGAQPAREIARDDPHGARAGAKTSERHESSRSRSSSSSRPFSRSARPTKSGRGLSGGAYQSILRRVDAFLDEPMAQALKERDRRARKILKLDDAVSAAVEKLKAKGLTSPYLKPFVVARVNYTRFSKATSFDFDETMDKIHRFSAQIQYRAGPTGGRREGLGRSPG